MKRMNGRGDTHLGRTLNAARALGESLRAIARPTYAAIRSCNMQSGRVIVGRVSWRCNPSSGTGVVSTPNIYYDQPLVSRALMQGLLYDVNLEEYRGGIEEASSSARSPRSQSPYTSLDTVHVSPAICLLDRNTHLKHSPTKLLGNTADCTSKATAPVAMLVVRWATVFSERKCKTCLRLAHRHGLASATGS
jgi:hypothetical protein